MNLIKIMSDKLKRYILFSTCFSVAGIFSLHAQSNGIMVKGNVTGNGEPLTGVTVRVDGTTTGTVTDLDGNYSITVSNENVTLSFSFISYVTQKVKVGSQRTINVAMVEDSKALQEVVVIGYGAVRKESVTGSVSSMKGDIVREVPAANLSNALQGRVAGVNITQTSTKPGTSMQIRVRGTRSINASNDPLIVLDGIPFAGTIGDIAPDDIKSVDILKDASATAIYGSRGANGVILVTSYSGNKNQKAQVSYNGYYGWKDAIKYPMMDAAKFSVLRKAAGFVKAPGADEPTNPDGSYIADTDWQDLLYQAGSIQNHDLNVMGGSEKGSYKFGAGYYKDQAVIPESWYSRISIRGSIDQKIGIFRIGFTTNNNYNLTNGASLGLGHVLQNSAVSDPYNADGTSKRAISMGADASQYVLTKSILSGFGDGFADQTKAFGSYNSAYGEVEIPWVEGLKARVNLGGNYRQSNRGTYNGIGVLADSPTNPSNASITNEHTTNWAIENMLTYDRLFAEKHQVNAVVLYSAEQTTYDKSVISRKNIAADFLQYYNLGQSSTSNSEDITIDPKNQDYWQSGLMSWMGRVMYSYDDRYMISATIRSDASSILAPGHQWHTYPAVSVGWNLGNELFMENLTWLDDLKLRLGFGQTSNQSVKPYDTLGRLGNLLYNFGANNATGYYVSQLPNPNLGWEYSKTTNVGVDFTLFKNRLSGTFEYYVTDTKDLLLNVSMPASTGVTYYTGNIGSTQNKGWEFSLNGTILKNVNGWTWDAGINFAGNKNKIVSLASEQQEDKTNWLFVGHPINVIYDYNKIGIWQTSEADAVKQYEGSAGIPGMIKVEYTGEYNADGSPKRIIGAEDRKVIDCDPRFTGGFNTRVAYKGIDMTVVGTFQNGGILNSTLYGANGYLNMLNGRRGQVDVDYWTPDNPTNKFPGAYNGSDNTKYASTLGYFSGTYLKVSTITLGYNIDPQWIKKAGLAKLRVYFTAQNPFVLFSPYHSESGLDPETNSYANDTNTMATLSGATGTYLTRQLVVGYNTPVTRNYMFGINVTF